MVGLERIGGALAVGGIVACGPNVDAGSDGSSTDSTAEGPGPEGPEEEGPEGPSTLDTGGDDGGAILVTDERGVDLIFVVDNSGTMGEEQGRLVAGIAALVERFEAEAIDYRIAVTTTDNGNPWCNTAPAAGKFVATSCLARTGDFVFTGDPPADATAVACTDQCNADELGILPSTTELDPNATPRPWIENIAGVSNLASLASADALRCMLPQGIAGCGFEQPLESMYKALLRTANEDEVQYGFLRASAVLAIVLVSDETDCSFSNDWQSIFSSEADGGNQVFWSDPAAASPSSAVCWNAGVGCTGGPGTYEECHSESYDVDGNPGADEGNAVMLPVSRYIEFLQELEDMKGQYVPEQDVVFAALTGVPVGYETGMAELVYQDGDAETQLSFGIGYGCVDNTGGGGSALPPVREREVAEAFEVLDQRNVFSICANDYSPALDRIANAIADEMHPPCFPACVADTNPVTSDQVDASCTVVQQSLDPGGGISEVDVPQCEGGAVPDGAEVCWEPLTDGALSPQCEEEGWNLELQFVRQPGVPSPPGAGFAVTCELSSQKQIDCPDL